MRAWRHALYNNPRWAPACKSRTSTIAAAGSNQATYIEPGPFRVAQLPPITIPLGQSRSGPVSLQLEVYHNAGATRSPLAIITPGFLLESNLYRSYAQALAAHGWTAVLWDVSEVGDDTTTVNHLRSVMDFATMDARLAPLADASRTYLIGHSRGGKLSCLAAACDERVRGLCLLDPVDNTPMTPSGPGYPSCLPGLRAISSRQRNPVPVVVVGAAKNQDVIPTSGNYKRFVGVCDGPLWEVDLSGAGHLQFLDRQVPLLAAVSAPGPTPDTTVRAISRDAMLAWGEKVVRPSRQLLPPEALEDFFATEGSALACLAPLSTTLRGLHRISSAAPSPSSSSQRPPTPPPSSSTSYTSSSKAAPPPPPPPPPPSPASPSASGGRKKATWSRSWSGIGTAAADASWEGGLGGASTSQASSTSSSTNFSSSGTASSTSTSTKQDGASASGRSSSGQAAGGGAAASGRAADLDADLGSYEDLMKKRAREIKAMLQDRGIDASDCFEKEDLVRRLLERTSVKVSGR